MASLPTLILRLERLCVRAYTEREMGVAPHLNGFPIFRDHVFRSKVGNLGAFISRWRRSRIHMCEAMCSNSLRLTAYELNSIPLSSLQLGCLDMEVAPKMPRGSGRMTVQHLHGCETINNKNVTICFCWDTRTNAWTRGCTWKHEMLEVSKWTKSNVPYN